jgi:hypothetical protein
MSLQIFPTTLTETIISKLYSHELFKIILLVILFVPHCYLLYCLIYSFLPTKKACTTTHNNFSSLGKGRTLLACSPSSFPARHPATYVTVEVPARNGLVPRLSTGVDSYKQSRLSSTIPISNSTYRNVKILHSANSK